MTESINSSPEPIRDSVEWLRTLLSNIREDETKEIPSDPETLFTSLGLDSLDIITTVDAAEEKFNITISDEDLEDIRTLGDFSDLIERLLDREIPPILPLNSRPFKNSYRR